MTTRLSVGLGLVLVLSGLAARAEPAGPATADPVQPDPTGVQSSPAGAQPSQDMLDRWNALSPEAREQLKAKLDRWKRHPRPSGGSRSAWSVSAPCPPRTARACWRTTPARKRFGEAERTSLLRRFERWQRLTDQERQRFRKELRRVKRMDPARHQRLMRKLQRWLRMSPEEREQVREKLRQRRQRR